jgi:hypothetical protein
MADTPRNPGADALSAAGAAPLILLSSPVIPVTNGTLSSSGSIPTVSIITIFGRRTFSAAFNATFQSTLNG